MLNPMLWLLQEKRVEVLDLQALLEAERVSQTDPEKRGNSIFSEVEDRRQQVERHLSKLTALLDKEKRKNQDLQAEIVKVKVRASFARSLSLFSFSVQSFPVFDSILFFFFFSLFAEPNGVFSLRGKQF